MTKNNSRALVLGGGGAVGIGWQVGVLQGLQREAVDLGADAVLGTSAGAVVGAFLCTGKDLSLALTSVQGLTASIDPTALHHGNDQFLELMRAADLTSDPTSALQSIGQAAKHADTIDQDRYLKLFDALADTEWPAALHITAIDADTGILVVWDNTSGVPLRAAVAASCALPMLFPAVELEGHSYIDGGMASHLNATATPKAPTTVVLSCHPLHPADRQPAPPLTDSEVRAAHELEEIRQRTTLLAFEPDLISIGATPRTMMSPEVARTARDKGFEQARTIASDLSARSES